MSFWTAVVIVFAIAAWAAIRITRIKAGDTGSHRRHRRGEALEPPAPSPRELELQGEVEQLRDRVKVLERIATDANTIDARDTRAIAAEIEALRDR